MRTCDIETCDARHYSKGYCTRHYRRLRDHGSAMWTPPTTQDKFLRLVDIQTDGCWHWTGARNPGGYGVWGSPRTASTLAHRCSYELFVGPISEGMFLDHLCRKPSCVRPDHLEPVTPAENVGRGMCGVLRTHCKNDHELTPENVYVYPADNSRRCRRCMADYNRQYSRVRRARAKAMGGAA